LRTLGPGERPVMRSATSWVAAWRRRQAVRGRTPLVNRFHTRPLQELEDRTAPAVFTVSTLTDSGPGSLRQAILDANAHANNAGDPTDRITFTVAGSIAVAGALPALSDATGGTALDATTAPGYSGAPVVVLHGPGATSNVTGLTITSAGNTVCGLQIDSFTVGIDLSGAAATGNVVTGNYVGTNGTAAVRNATGIALTGASNNRIGTN